MRLREFAVCAEKLSGHIYATLNRPLEAAILIFASLAAFLAHRALHR